MKEIFLVEDDDGIRELIEYLLVSQEYKVQSFPTVKTFKKTISEQNSPDLILLDVMLPDGNGVDVCRCLGEKENTQKIPVVLMSAHGDFSEPGVASDFIAKPFDVDDFLLRIQKQIQG